MRVCLHCDIVHTFVCDCGHWHDQHIRSGGCRYQSCKGCDGYSQEYQRLPDESEKQFRDRIGGNRTAKKKYVAMLKLRRATA